MQYSSFFNAEENAKGEYDRTYDADDLAEYFATFIGNGIFANPSNTLQVQAGANLNIIIEIGKAFINGYRYKNTEPLTLTLPPANGTYNFIVNIVCELSLVDRNILIKLVPGSPSPTPKAPALIQTTSTYQLCLAQVEVQAGATSINQSNITDTRLITQMCGVVVSTVQQLSTTTLYEQWQKGFDSWFTGIKGIFKDFSAKQELLELITEVKALNEDVYLLKNAKANGVNCTSVSNFKINDTQVFNPISEQAGMLFINGTALSYTVSGWYLSDYAFSSGNKESIFGVIVINLSTTQGILLSPSALIQIPISISDIDINKMYCTNILNNSANTSFLEFSGIQSNQINLAVSNGNVNVDMYNQNLRLIFTT